MRARAAAFLKAYRDTGAGPIDIGPAERLPRSMALAVGVEEVPPEDLEIWLEELALDPYARGLKWASRRSRNGCSRSRSSSSAPGWAG